MTENPLLIGRAISRGSAKRPSATSVARATEASDHMVPAGCRPFAERSPEGRKQDDIVRIQYSLCQSGILPGPAKTLRWGVPDGTRGPDGELVHDDHVVADSLVAKLDELEWRISSPTLIVHAKDPLIEMSRTRRTWGVNKDVYLDENGERYY